ncbi:hypothetical protein N780_15750 [Pontibacillus chungwhensis BH030062]|uniref:DUF2268 domain-containing protein n=1 Tax=Pontibacillus chungwhensis BH030062 TaxID=1385513 RepID=A0A0A2VDT3_9BACI|nr:DUF2268 domain-containing putative Zn-dependent protease [Pontibacillus chungwhensis]KGP91820.1 hypothetical protein N780_15750 [Pontibacillus chungwhensis BH030062]
MNEINQLTPEELYTKKDTLEDFLSTELRPLINNKSWMKEWEQIALRFKLLQFKSFSQEEALAYQWDTGRVREIIEDTILQVRQHITLDEVKVTVVPALPFPWFKNLDRSIWTNGFTNSPNSIQLAIPPNPDEQFLRYLIAHELHHASPNNPIYELTLETFTLGEWYKMEGTAEFFSLNLYEDKRWWKKDLSRELELEYWSKAKQEIDTTDDRIKSQLCFGDSNKGIPQMIGYAFAHEMIKSYVKKHPISNYNELYFIDVLAFIDEYENGASASL